MDNEYKVSWIDTNPQNSSMNEQYVFKRNTDRKKGKKEEVEEDSYEPVLQESKNRFLSRYELKNVLDSVLKNLPLICADRLLLHSPSGFASYLHDK